VKVLHDEVGTAEIGYFENVAFVFFSTLRIAMDASLIGPTPTSSMPKLPANALQIS